ncbi:MAG TPA: lipid-binding SYLF domain-containing protein [Bryobacteraceae bacterium]|nr:lipid-binding SYLF domain-containing protein [Bryobacteraceae bacterium]
MKRILPILLAAPMWAQSSNPHAARLEEAGVVLQEIMDTKDKSIPQDLIDKAQCAIVVPGVKSGAFIVGGKYGRGYVTCRKPGGGWGAPGAVRVEGGSVGFQIGGSETDVVMLVMNERGAKRLFEKSKFTVGGEAMAAAGPVGRTSSAETDATMRAEILSWSRSRGAFAGISLKGSTMRDDEDAIKALYGSKMKNADIVFSNTPPPASASKLLTLLSKYSAHKDK